MGFLILNQRLDLPLTCCYRCRNMKDNCKTIVLNESYTKETNVLVFVSFS